MHFVGSRRTRTVDVLPVALFSGVLLITGLWRPAAAQNSGGQTTTKYRTGTTFATAKMEAWRTVMMKPRAKQPGCYQAHYPDKGWHSVPCETAPLNSNARPPRIARPLIAGGDSIAQSESGSIQSATGTLSQILRNTNATGFGGISNEFSMQLNTNTFSTTSYGCNNQPGCQGWDRFYIDSGGSIQIETWLLNYLNARNLTCPSGFAPSPPNSASCLKYFRLHEFFNNEIILFANFAGVMLTGEADNVNDTITMSLPNGTLLQMAIPDSTLLLAGKWTSAEFNVLQTVTMTQ